MVFGWKVAYQRPLLLPWLATVFEFSPSGRGLDWIGLNEDGLGSRR